MKQKELIIMVAIIIIAAIFWLNYSGDLPSLERQQPMVTVVYIQLPPCDGTEGRADCYKPGADLPGTICKDGECPDDNQ